MLALHNDRLTSKKTGRLCQQRRIVTINSSFDISYLKFKFLDNNIEGRFSQLFNFGEKSYNLWAGENFCISQGSVVTCSGVEDKCIRSRILCTKNYYKISSFLTELYQKK